MNANYRLFHEYEFSQHDDPALVQHDAVARFLDELGTERVIALTRTKLTITVWFWDQEKKIRNDIGEIRCGVQPILHMLSTPISPWTVMCKK